MYVEVVIDSHRLVYVSENDLDRIITPFPSNVRTKYFETNENKQLRVRRQLR